MAYSNHLNFRVDYSARNRPNYVPKLWRNKALEALRMGVGDRLVLFDVFLGYVAIRSHCAQDRSKVMLTSINVNNYF